MDKIMNRKRLIYDINEDIYFYIYNILFILNTLECYSSQDSFKDYRKLVFLIDFISNDRDCDIFIRYYRGKFKANDNIRRNLRDKYYKGIEKIKILRYVLLIMEKHNYVRLENDEKRVNIILIRENRKEVFFENKRFKEVVETIKKIPSPKTLRKVSYKTFIENIFKINGVDVWED